MWKQKIKFRINGRENKNTNTSQFREVREAISKIQQDWLGIVKIAN